MPPDVFETEMFRLLMVAGHGVDLIIVPATLLQSNIIPGCVYRVMSIRTTRYGGPELERPVAIVGFPGVGLVSSIVSNFYVGQLDMPAIAGMSSPDMPPYCLISHGTAYPPVRFYGHKATTKTGRDVIVCLSEYTPKPEQCYELAHEVMGFLRRMGCEDVICLEGIPRFSPEEVMVACGSGPGAAKLMKKSKVPVMDGGMVRGLTGVMLYDGPGTGLNIVALMCPANQNLPDPGSAVGFVSPISKMVPGLRVDTKPLLDEAEEIQKRMQAERVALEKDSDSAYYG